MHRKAFKFLNNRYGECILNLCQLKSFLHPLRLNIFEYFNSLDSLVARHIRVGINWIVKLFTAEYLLSACLLASTFLISACTQPSRQYDYSIFAFGTLIDITLYDVNRQQAETAFNKLQKDFDRYHKHWSPWTDGDLAQLNRQLADYKTGNSAVITVPAHIVPMIETSMQLSQQSNDYYNPAIGKLINLWRFHQYQDKDIKPPDAQQIRQLVAQNPRISDLSLNPQYQLTSKNPALALNFGAFAKGYAIALEIKQLQNMGIQHAVINAGGDLSVIGQHGERPWNIGIRHPRKDSILASIEVKSDESVFTSGDYERFYFYQDKRYHHILDPGTGYPTDDAQSVTVIDADAARADAAATALFVAGSANWQRIAKAMSIQYAMLIDADGNIHMTAAMEKRIKFLEKTSTFNKIISKQL
jgi:thiamine biosynthesis lipoprotein